MSRRLLLVAGETSGDMHAARLAAVLKRTEPSLELVGMGQAAMAKAGVRLYVRSDEIAVVGILEVLKYLGKIRSVFKTLLANIDKERPDLAILVDYPGFNLRLSAELKRRGIPVVYYISPQIWAWWKSRISTIRRNVSKMLVIFPFEQELYKKHGVPVEFVGHPLLDSAKATAHKDALIRSHAGLAGKKLISLLPGSREREIELILPVMLESAGLIRRRYPETHFLISKAPGLPDGLFEKYLKGTGLPHTAVRNEDGCFYKYLASSDIALVASGTATLECAIAETPLIIIYKVATVSAIITRMLIKVPYVGLVNIVAGRKIAPEFLQLEARPKFIAKEAVSILSNKEKNYEMRRALDEVKRKLGSPGSSERAARIIIEFLTEINPKSETLNPKQIRNPKS